MTAAVGAYLREVFKEAAENTQGWLFPLADERHPWHLLYARVRDTNDGALEMLKEIQLLNDRIQALEEENARLRGQLPRPVSLPLRAATGED